MYLGLVVRLLPSVEVVDVEDLSIIKDKYK